MFKKVDGVIYMNKPIVLNENNSVLYSDTKAIIKIPKDYEYDCIVDCRNENAIGKIRIENICFDASECDRNVKGIVFKQLIYNNIFRNLEFESFQDSWIYNCCDKISEHLEFSMIQGNCRYKTPKSPLFYLERINESTFNTIKLYAHQYIEKKDGEIKDYPNINCMVLDCPQNVVLNNISFNNTHGIPLKVVTTKNNRIRGLHVNNCIFEDCSNPISIYLVGNDKLITEYCNIDCGSIIESDNYIYVDNCTGLLVNDLKTGIWLDKNTNDCIIKTNNNIKKKIIDYGKNNSIITYGDFVTVKRGDNSIGLNPDYGLIRIKYKGDKYDIKVENDKIIQKKNGIIINTD